MEAKTIMEALRMGVTSVGTLPSNEDVALAGTVVLRLWIASQMTEHSTVVAEKKADSLGKD